MTPRVALIHDWITGMRGGEKALEAFAEIFPQAELFTLLHVPGSGSPTIERLRSRRSILRWLPGLRRYYRWCLPLFPALIEQFDLDRFDLVISTSHSAAKSVVKMGRARHLCYCLTPMRYGWDQFEAYFGQERIGRLPSRALRPIMAWLARWDAATAHRVDRYVAISQYVASRIRRYYNREATVVYPPVDTTFYYPDGTAPERFFLIVSALVPYKRIDLAIAASRLAGVPLRVVGDGPERKRLDKNTAGAGAAVGFLGTRSDAEVRDLYRRAAATLLPGEEDFGIAPLEAQACGRPVVALGRGGALETVIDGVTGVLVPEATAEALADGMRRALATRWDGETIRRHALRFDRARFTEGIQKEIGELLGSNLRTS